MSRRLSRAWARPPLTPTLPWWHRLYRAVKCWWLNGRYCTRCGQWYKGRSPALCLRCRLSSPWQASA